MRPLICSISFQIFYGLLHFSSGAISGSTYVTFVDVI